MKLYSVEGCTSRWHRWCRQLLWYGAENLGNILTHINSKVHVFWHSNLDDLICVFRRVRRHVSLIAYCPGGLLTSNNERRVYFVNRKLSERRFHLRGVGARLGGIVKVLFRIFPIYVNEVDGRRFVALVIWDAHSRRRDWIEIRCHRFDIRVAVVARVFRHFDFFLEFVRRDGSVLDEIVILRMFARRIRRVWFPRRTVRFKCCENRIADYLFLKS